MSAVPPRLRLGDTIGVCAPAGPVDAERLRVGVAALEQFFRVRVSDAALAVRGYLAGDDESRAAELNALIRDRDVRAIVLARGGYGLTRILDRLDASELRADPKLIVGYSDATVLLAWAERIAGVRGIHGPMVGHFGELASRDQRWLIDMMTSPEPAGELPHPCRAIGAPAAGTLRGRLIGGNLCMLSHLAGTPYALDTTGALLLLEDVGERPYAIDRYVTHLQMSGALDGVVGVALGDLLRCEETSSSPSPTAEEVMDERLSAFRIPALAEIPIGHGARNFSVPFGAMAELDFDAGVLRLLEAAVG